jgi:hypothetical protein
LSGSRRAGRVGYASMQVATAAPQEKPVTRLCPIARNQAALACWHPALTAGCTDGRKDHLVFPVASADDREVSSSLSSALLPLGRGCCVQGPPTGSPQVGGCLVEWQNEIHMTDSAASAGCGSVHWRALSRRRTLGPGIGSSVPSTCTTGRWIRRSRLRLRNCRRYIMGMSGSSGEGCVAAAGEATFFCAGPTSWLADRPPGAASQLDLRA